MLNPGDYAKGSEGQWWLRTPNGLASTIDESVHDIEEHAGGTISVVQSIKVAGAHSTWHGYLERGVWREA